MVLRFKKTQQLLSLAETSSFAVAGAAAANDQHVLSDVVDDGPLGEWDGLRAVFETERLLVAKE